MGQRVRTLSSGEERIMAQTKWAKRYNAELEVARGGSPVAVQALLEDLEADGHISLDEDPALNGGQDNPVIGEEFECAACAECWTYDDESWCPSCGKEVVFTA